MITFYYISKKKIQDIIQETVRTSSMAQKVLTGNYFLKGQSYPTIASEIVIEIKKGSTWDEEFFIQGDFTTWNINFYVAKQFGEDRMAVGRIDGLQFGNFILPANEEREDPIEYQNYTYFHLIIDSNVTDGMEVTPIAFKEIGQPKVGRDYWQADLEASKTIANRLVVEPLGLDLIPVVVRGEV
jgi:hypothetical protein